MPAERKCFRMIGGTLVERTVGEVLPALEETQVGVNPPFMGLILVAWDRGAAHDAIQKERRRVQEMAEG